MHGTLHDNYPLPCPPPLFFRRALCARPLLCPPPLPLPPSVRARCTAMRSPFPISLLPPPLCSGSPVFSRLLCALCVPTPLALPVTSSLFPACPRCITLRRHAAHCTFGGGLPCGSTPRRSALSCAPARCGRPARWWGTSLLLPLIRSLKPPWHAICMRSNVRGNAPSPPPLSAPAPWPCPAPCLLVPSHPSLPRFPGCGPWPGSLAFCLSAPSFSLPPRRALYRAMCEATLQLSIYLSAPSRPGLLASCTHFALHPPAAFFPRPHLLSLLDTTQARCTSYLRGRAA